MFIVRRDSGFQPRYRTFCFPYAIGIARPNEKMPRRWRPTDSTPLTGDIVGAMDIFGTASKLERLVSLITESMPKIPVEWIDVADKASDSMDVCIDVPSHEIDRIQFSWDRFEEQLTWAFGLDVL
jgi:hypothetical protein